MREMHGAHAAAPDLAHDAIRTDRVPRARDVLRVVEELRGGRGGRLFQEVRGGPVRAQEALQLGPQLRIHAGEPRRDLLRIQFQGLVEKGLDPAPSFVRHGTSRILGP